MSEERAGLDARGPDTVRGMGLAGALKKSRAMPDPEVDWTAWIADIEAVAVERQRLAEAVRALVSPQTDRIGYWERDSRLINRSEVLALLEDTSTPSKAEPSGGME